MENHRQREEGNIIYPVYSRRSGGLSVGVNLFPDKKRCNFDCPYCEVFPFERDAGFDIETMKSGLEKVLAAAGAQNNAVKDICFSGNGEPTLSPCFPAALEAAALIRQVRAPQAELVVITNGTGLLRDETFDLLREAASGPMALDIWLKLDAGTGFWYKAIDRSAVPFERLTGKIRDFARIAPVTIQTMLCTVNQSPPSRDEAAAWLSLALELAGTGNIRKFQIYGKARPAPLDPLASALPVSFLEERAAALREALETAGLTAAVEVYP
ncbi:MAG: radical SAM protein [Treponema sp.]|nr:radical SAM protein [Treponema sp.]